MFREATDKDLVALRDLEREANLVGLAHVFPADRFPFPDDAVVARWRLVLDDPEVTVLVLDAENHGGLVAYAAHDDATLRHLAVHPDHWGKGLGTAAIEIAVHAMDLRGSTEASLWCLQDNHRARRLYEYLGWSRTEDSQEASWPPHPIEIRYTRLIVQSER